MALYVYPKLKDTPASEVTKGMVVGILDKVGRDRQSDIVKSAISSSYRWGMKRHLEPVPKVLES
jgi:hypothetical protein